MIDRWRRGALALVLLLAATGMGAAQDADRHDAAGEAHRIGASLFASGFDVVVAEAGVRNVFAGGEGVTITAPVAGTVHAAARSVRISAAVGGLYAAGYRVQIDAPVAKDAVAFGYAVEVGAGGSIGGDAVLTGRKVTLDGPVAGDAVLTGETVTINAAIGGSADIRAREIRFGPNAKVGGTLSYKSPVTQTVPATVAAADRVEARVMPMMQPPVAETYKRPFAWLAALAVAGLILVLLLLPVMVSSGAVLVERFWTGLLAGFLALSALIGSIVVAAVTVIGLPLVPLILVAIPLLLLAGYLTSAFTLGGAVIARLRGGRPASRLLALAATLLGLVILALLGAVPFLGWLVGLVATMAGLGALALSLFGRPLPKTLI